MRCPNCDSEIPDGVRICPKCGANTQEKAPLLIHQPASLLTDTPSKTGGMQTAVRVWATIMLIVGIIAVVIVAWKFGFQEEVYTYYGKTYHTGQHSIVPEIFWPVLIGGGFGCAGHFILMLAIADALEKLGDIRYYLSRK